MDRDLTPRVSALRLQNDVGAELLRTNTDGTRVAQAADYSAQDSEHRAIPRFPLASP